MSRAVLSAPERGTPTARQDEVWWTFAALPVHARLARVWLAGWLEHHGPDATDRAFGALVAFSDILAGTVLHGTGPVSVHVRLREGRVLCEVRDTGANLPALLEADLEGAHRRGLSLAAALTTDLTVRAAPGGGKTIAFTADLTRADPAPLENPHRYRSSQAAA